MCANDTVLMDNEDYDAFFIYYVNTYFLSIDDKRGAALYEYVVIKTITIKTHTWHTGFQINNRCKGRVNKWIIVNSKEIIW